MAPSFAIPRRLAALLAALAAAAALAQQPPPGQYVTEGGWGWMTVKRNGEFEIESAGANGHSCSVDGKIVKGRAETAEDCVIDFKPGAGGRVSVIVPEKALEACRYHCGMRARFAGDYFPQVAACTDGPVKAARSKFSRLYKAQQHAQAAQVLAALVGDCGRFLYWTAEAEVRNDLALAHARAGDKPACRQALEPLRPHFIDNPDVTFTPLDEEWGQRMVKAIRFNWKLCAP